MRKIIMISGKQGSGKSAVRDIILSKLPMSIHCSFAEPLRGLVKGLSEVSKDLELNIEVEESRELMQFLGSWARNINRNVWVERAVDLVNSFPPNIIPVFDDLRFPNEFDAFPATTIRLVCPEEIRKERAKYWGNPEHISETALDDHEDLFDYVLDTRGNLKTLEHQIENILLHMERYDDHLKYER
jgi:hypothetical protein